MPNARTAGSRFVVMLTAAVLALTLAPPVAATPVADRGHGGPAYKDPNRPVTQRVADLLGRMTLAEKVGQMTQAERGWATEHRGQVTELALGSVLSGGGSVPTPNTAAAWADMVDGFQEEALKTRLAIPIIYGVDAVHGHGNLAGATIFPHNIGLGATRNPALVSKAAAITAEEVRATGIPWNFSPCLCVTRDARWGRSYESFGEDPALVALLGTAAVVGLQGRGQRGLADNDHVLATVKHFAGDGNTTYGTPVGDYTVDQGITITNRQDFARIDLAPFWSVIRAADPGSAMPSFSSVDWTDDGIGNPIKMHQNQELISGVLKAKMRLDGFVISDWEGIHQLPGTYAEQVRAGVNAGIDMFMEPNTAGEFVTTLKAEVKAGRVPMSRIDDAVSRILTKKFELGLFEHPFAYRTHQRDIGSPQHRAVARQAVAESQVLLKNDGNALPLRRDAAIYVAGRNADDIGNQSGGWTLTWQGFSSHNAGGVVQQKGTSILDGIRQVAPKAKVTYSADGTAPTAGAQVAIVAVGETPYSEGFGDVGGPQWAYDPADAGVPREPKSLELQPQDKQTVQRVCAQVPTCVVLVVSGRPQIVTDLVGDADALVASWLPGTEGAGVADVLFGKQAFTGKLPVSWPRTADQEPINVGDANYDPLYRYGFGLSTRRTR
ncbi:glycoside hydrolase family 3 protein [Nakamurella sp.]|uniref:glycoside hydrolase family 3 protein n=1 Tax=Nakamurella sp. TaxID=1869182 RepID=UPI003784C48F